MCSFLFHISEHGQIKEKHSGFCEYPFGGLVLGIEGSRELLTWKTFAGRATWSWFSLGGSLVLVVPLPQLQWGLAGFPLGLVLSLPPDSSSLPNAEEHMREHSVRGWDCPEGADPVAACMEV